MSFLTPVELVPVAQWVYDLYKVTYWRDEQMTRFIKTMFFASSSEGHLLADIDENAPGSECYYTWETVKENVGHPRQIGTLHGLPISESARSHGERLAQTLK